MNNSIVTKLPLLSLETAAGVAVLRGNANTEDIRSLLKAGPVRFVVADVGQPLQWISQSECFKFWKNEARLHIAETDCPSLDDFQGSYCYFASHWTDGGEPIILLSKAH